MNARIALVAAVAAVVLAGPLAAQKAKPAPRCAPVDTTAAWARAQRAWLADATVAPSDASFREALLAAVPSASAGMLFLGADVAGETPALSLGDTTLVARLRALAAQRGSKWPTRSVVGGNATLAVWSLAAHDTALAGGILKHMMEAGPDESPPAAVATLEDRLRLARGRKQLYATQWKRNADGTVEPLPTEDLAHVDLRREGATLPPLRVSACAARRR